MLLRIPIFAAIFKLSVMAEEKDRTKKVKGSALYLEDGGLIFTPYNSCPTNSPWKKVVVTQRGKMKSSAEVIQVIITVPKDQQAQKRLMNEFSELMVQLSKVL